MSPKPHAAATEAQGCGGGHRVRLWQRRWVSATSQHRGHPHGPLGVSTWDGDGVAATVGFKLQL